MPSFHREIEIEASPDDVWRVLGDIGSVRSWVPGVTSVTVDGMARVCAYEDGHVQDERILDYSLGARSYRYEIDGSPLPVRDNTGTFAVEPLDGGARIVWESSFEPLDPAMADQLAAMWEPYLPLILGNLKRLIEGS